MDGVNQSSYILLPMNRLLLAFMALLAGLLAQGGPAQARDCGPGATQVGALEASVSQVCIASHAQKASIGIPLGDQPFEIGTPAITTLLTVLAPTVRIGIDRARE